MVKQDESAALRQTPRTGRVRSDSGRTAAAICIPRDVRAAMAHIRANPHRAISLAELAAEASVSMRTLEAHFRAFVGVTPSAYGVRLRLITARHDLQRAGEADVSSPRSRCATAFPILGGFRASTAAHSASRRRRRDGSQLPPARAKLKFRRL